MSKMTDAIIALIYDTHKRNSMTRTSYLRVAKACDMLQLTADERIELLSTGYLPYIDPETRELRPKFRSRK